MNTTKPKILFVITKSALGGAGKYVYDLASSFKSEYDVVVASGGTGPLTEKCSASGIRTIEIKAFQRDINFIKEFQSFFELLSILRHERPALVHLNSSKAGGTGACAGRIHNLFSKEKCRIIFTAHGWAFKEHRDGFQMSLIKCLSWITVLFSHAVITVSEDDRVRALWMPFVAHKLITVRNGIPPQHFLSREESRTALHLTSEERLVIGTIAELHQNKGLTYAVDALEELAKTDMHLTLCIIGEGEERERLEQHIASKKPAVHVVLAGKIIDASKYLSAFDLFLLPSIKEGLPYTILEAGAAGVPTVATCVGGIPEVIDDMQSGILVRPKDAHEIAAALRFLVEHEDKRNIFADTLKTRVLQDLTLARMVQETKKIYTNS